MENGLITFEQMTYHNLMPWVNQDQYTGVFKELVNRIDDAHVSNHQLFFHAVLTAFGEIRLPVDPKITEEWRRFGKLPEFENLNYLVAGLAAFKHHDPKVRFYTLLAVNCAKGVLLTTANRTLHAESKPYSQYIINKSMQRLEAMIVPKQPASDINEVDLLIFKIIKLALLMVYIEIDKGFPEYIERKQLNLNHNQICELLAICAMNDKRLKEIAEKYLKRYRGTFKKKGKRDAQLEELPNIFSSFSKANANKGASATKRRPDKLQDKATSSAEKDGASDGGKVIGSREAMNMLGISKTTLKRRIEQGLISALPRNNNREHYKFLLQDIEKLRNIPR